MRIGHLNVRSLFTGFDDFRAIVEQNHFDIIMLSETWLTGNLEESTFNIPGYKFVHKDRVGRGGGVAAYIKNNFCFQVFRIKSAVSDLLEFLFFEITLDKRRIAFCVFYRPPQANLNTCINDFDSLLSNLSPTFDEVILTGDLNLDFLNIKNPISDCLSLIIYFKL